MQSARRTAGTVFSPLRGAAETVSEPFSNAWHGITDYGDLEDENEELRGSSRSSRASAVLEEDAAEQLDELLEQQDLEWVGDIPTTAARVLSGSPSNFSHTIDITKGSDDGHQGGHAGGQRRRARRRGRAGHDRPIHGAAHHRPRLRRRRPAARRPRSPAPPAARAAARTSSSTRNLEPDADDLPKPGTSADHERHRPQPPSPPRSRSGRCARCSESSGGLTIDLVVRPHGRHRAAGLRHRAALGAAGVIPPSPLTVAVRTLAGPRPRPHHPARRRSRPRAVRRAGRPPPAGRDRRRHRGRPRPGRRHRLRRRARLRPLPPDARSACPRSPTRSSPTWSGACRTRCSGPPGGSRS